MKRRQTEPVTPLIYVGSKANLLPEIATALPVEDTDERRWLVPFCGSLAPVFKFRPKRAILSDLNPELIHFWEQIRDNAKAVLKYAYRHLPGAKIEGGLKEDRQLVLKPQYYEARVSLNNLIARGVTGPERAGLFLIINRFGWRGLWRVNQKGECNIPFYRPNGTLPSLKLLRSCQRYLQLPEVELRCERWDQTLAGYKVDDFAYIDSPYDGVTYTYASATDSAEVFGDLSQIALAAALVRMARQGVPFMAHNNPTLLVQNIYRAPFIQRISMDKDHKLSYGKRLDPSAKEAILTSAGVNSRAA